MRKCVLEFLFFCIVAISSFCQPVQSQENDPLFQEFLDIYYHQVEIRWEEYQNLQINSGKIVAPKDVWFDDNYEKLAIEAVEIKYNKLSQ